MGTYSRGTYVTLPTDDGDLTTVMSAGEVSDVATINNVFVGQNLSNQIAAEMFKNTCSASLANLLWVGQSDLAPSISPITLEAYNYSTAAWVGQATNAAAAANATCTLGVMLGTTQYISPGGYTTGRVYQASSSILDNFNRSNANPIDGNWTTHTGDQAMQISSNVACAQFEQLSVSYWTAGSFSDNQWAQVAYVGSLSAGPCVRLSTTDAKGILVHAQAAISEIQVWQNTGAGWATLGTAWTGQTISVGDILKITVSGTAVEVFFKGVSLGTRSCDATITTGRPGISGYNLAGAVDDFSAGDL